MSNRLGKKRRAGDGARIKIHDRTAGSTDHLHPIFCLKNLRRDHCLSKCNKEQKAAFADKLHQLSQVPWIEIRQSHRHKLGSEIIDKDTIKADIPVFITPDVKILAFRFWKKAPMLGYKSGEVFHIIWLDPKFELYGH